MFTKARVSRIYIRHAKTCLKSISLIKFYYCLQWKIIFIGMSHFTLERYFKTKLNTSNMEGMWSQNDKKCKLCF